MTLQKSLPATLLIFVMSVTPLLAHHSVASQYDSARATTFQGVITRVEWLNPHVWISMDAKHPNGSVTSWRVQLAAPGALLKAGLNKDLIDLTKSYSVEVWPAFDGSNHANGRKLTFSDGKTFDVSDKWPSAPAINPVAK